MPRFVKFENADGKPIWINPNNVALFIKATRESVHPELYVTFIGEKSGVTLRETPDSFLEIDGASGKIVVQTSDLRLGDATATEAVVLGTAFATLFNAHVHPDPASGFTGVPTVAMVSPTHLSIGVKVK